MTFYDTENDVARGERAVVIVPEKVGEGGRRSTEARLEEAEGLAEAIGVEVVARKAFRLRQIRPATLLGKGQVEEIAELARENNAKLLIVDASLSPVQQKSLEEQVKAKVIDRTSLILEIFGERAATAEGRLQVELAHLDYQAGRLVRTWTHLERQRGGFGFLGGPGETQIEADRRLIRDRMARIRRELDQVKRTRALHRGRRQRAPWPVIALVGYTNAGKSTLFNTMTGDGVLAEDMLFATLDPTMRNIRLPGFDKAILSDTVGFISDLPTDLVAAFRATLEEVQEAELILHVRDLSHPETEAQKSDVEHVLKELGLEDRLADIVEVWNKIDLLDPDRRTLILGQAERSDRQVAISAKTGQGCDRLLALIDARLSAGSEVRHLRLRHGDGAAIAWLYANGNVVARRDDEEFAHMTVRLDPAQAARFDRMQRREPE